ARDLIDVRVHLVGPVDERSDEAEAENEDDQDRARERELVLEEHVEREPQRTLLSRRRLLGPGGGRLRALDEAGVRAHLSSRSSPRIRCQSFVYRTRGSRKA